LLNASLRHRHELVIGEAGSPLVRPRRFFYCFGLVQLVVFFCFGGIIIQRSFDVVGNFHTLGRPFLIPFEDGRWPPIGIALVR
jgi:hypothetical protein